MALVYLVLLPATGLGAAWRAHHGDLLGVAVFGMAYAICVLSLALGEVK